MDLLKDNIGKLYARFLLTSFGSTLISSIYGLVDAAMVGRYHGPDGSAAMAPCVTLYTASACLRH